MLLVTVHTWAAHIAGFMQNHHTAREVFLTQQVDNNGVESLWRPAQVCLSDAVEKALGDDVFMCEYEYDTVWQVCLALLVLNQRRRLVLAGLTFKRLSSAPTNINIFDH